MRTVAACDLSYEGQLPFRYFLSYSENIVEFFPQFFVAHSFLSHLQHRDTKDAPDTTVEKNFK